VVKIVLHPCRSCRCHIRPETTAPNSKSALRNATQKVRCPAETKIFETSDEAAYSPHLFVTTTRAKYNNQFAAIAHASPIPEPLCQITQRAVDLRLNRRSYEGLGLKRNVTTNGSLWPGRGKLLQFQIREKAAIQNARVPPIDGVSKPKDTR
jgi:hypothetical protein